MIIGFDQILLVPSLLIIVRFLLPLIWRMISLQVLPIVAFLRFRGLLVTFNTWISALSSDLLFRNIFEKAFFIPTKYSFTSGLKKGLDVGFDI